jgi:hypothetical protein
MCNTNLLQYTGVQLDGEPIHRNYKPTHNCVTARWRTTLPILRYPVPQVLFLISTMLCSLLRLTVWSGLDVPTSATRHLHACHHTRAPSSGKWNCGREMSDKFCLNAEFHITFRDLLHAIKLWHGNERLYFPSEVRRAEDFFVLNIRRLRPGANPQTWVPKASTSRPPKLLLSSVTVHDVLPTVWQMT